MSDACGAKVIGESVDHLHDQFHKDGFVALPAPLLSAEEVDALNARLEQVLRGVYDTQVRPDKAPRKIKPLADESKRKGPLGFTGMHVAYY